MTEYKLVGWVPGAEEGSVYFPRVSAYYDTVEKWCKSERAIPNMWKPVALYIALNETDHDRD